MQDRAAKLIVTGDSASIPASFVDIDIDIDIDIEFGEADPFYRLERTVESKDRYPRQSSS